MEIKIEPMTNEAIEPFGKIVDIPDSAPTKVGDGWECWNYIQMMDVNTEIGMGLVNTKKPFVIDSMERHDGREELLIAIKGDIVQPLALSQELDNPEEKPRQARSNAFILSRGKGSS